MRSNYGLIAVASGTLHADIRPHPTEKYCKLPDMCSIINFTTMHVNIHVAHISQFSSDGKVDAQDHGLLTRHIIPMIQFVGLNLEGIALVLT